MLSCKSTLYYVLHSSVCSFPLDRFDGLPWIIMFLLVSPGASLSPAHGHQEHKVLLVVRFVLGLIRTTMTDLLANLSVPWGTQAIVSPNLTAAALVVPGSDKSLAPFCTFCCCGLLNRTLAVVFMVSLAFAIVVGNVVTLTVFMQTRQVRTPQGYLKGKQTNSLIQTCSFRMSSFTL